MSADPLRPVRAEIEHARRALRRLHRTTDAPGAPLALVVVVTVLLVLWGNAVVVAGRQLGGQNVLTLVAHGALALVVTTILLRRGWSRHALGLVPPRPDPDSRNLRLALTVVSVSGLVAAAATLALDPAKRLDVVRLLVGTATGEEVLHRSALLALWTSSPVTPVITTVANVAAFAGWHVAGAFHDGRFHPLDVAVPAAGALVFLWARLRYRSVAAPIFVHLATNLPGIILAP